MLCCLQGDNQPRMKNSENQGWGWPRSPQKLAKLQAVDKHQPKIQQEWLNLKDNEPSSKSGLTRWYQMSSWENMHC